MTGLSDTNKEQIDSLIQPITEYIKSYCNVIELNPSLELAGALMIEHLINSKESNIASESISDVGSVTYRDNYPEHIMNLLKINKIVKFNIF